MKPYLTIICLLTFIFCSCTTDTSTEVKLRAPRYFDDHQILSGYEISHRQNSSYLRLVDHIQFDEAKDKYILDIPEAWKDSIILTDSEYSDAQKIIDDLNLLEGHR